MVKSTGKLVKTSVWKDQTIRSDVWFEELSGLFNIDFIPEDLIYIEDELQQAIYISLLTNRRLPDDIIPDTINNDPAGWWNDILEDSLSGSYLYTLTRESLNDKTPSIVEEMVLESLSWLEEDNISDDTVVEVIRVGTSKITIKIIIFKNNQITNKYSYLWDNLEGNLTIS